MFNILKLFILALFLNSSIFAEEKISLQLLWKHQFEFAGFYIAKEKGFYKDAGLDVTIKEYDFGINITNDVLDGKVDIGIGRSSLILDRLNGSEITLLNALYQNSPYVLLSKKREDLKTVADFANKKIMLSDETAVAAIVSMMHLHDIRHNNYEFVPHSFNINELIENKVDLISVYLSNEPYELEKQNIEYTIFDPADYGFNFYADILFTSKKYIIENEKKVQKFQEASMRGWDYAFSHIDETVDLILKKYNSQNKSKEALLYEAGILRNLAYDEGLAFGSIDEVRIQEITNIYRLLGLATQLNANLKDFIYKKENLLQKIFTKEVLTFIAFFIVFVVFIVLYRQYLLKKQLEKQKELYEIVFDNAGEGVLLIDLAVGKFTKCNEQIVKMLRANSKEEILNSHPSQLSPEFQPDGRKSQEKADEMISLAIENGYNNFQWKHKRLNGKEFWAEISLNKIMIDEKAMLYVTWKDIDIEMQAKQELLHSQEELQLLNENLEKRIQERTQELEYAIRAKSDFLANMSHEIRTPLNGIIGFIDILHKNETHEDKLERLSVVKESGHSLLTIINDILDFSKLESNKVIIEKIPIDISKIFNHIAELFYSKASEKDINIVVDINENVPNNCLGDSTRIKQVVSNILSNAIKFSREHTSIRISLNYTKESHMLHCEIQDNGTGIAPENIKSIFNSFEQADSSVTRTHGGTGLGLAISKSLVELMGGTIEVKSELNVGSSFIFTLKLKETDEKHQTQNVENVETRQLQGKVLIVEDNKTNQMLLSILLDDLGLDADIANDGLEAVEAVKQTDYDIVLMDENMPNMNGKAATKIIRTLEKSKDLPIIAVTANALQGDRDKFIAAGMNDYLSKPIDNDALISILSKYL